MMEATLRPGYTELAAALENPLDSDEWDALVKDTLRLPLWMLPAVQIAMGKGVWRKANDPLKCVRENARREASRMGFECEVDRSERVRAIEPRLRNGYAVLLDAREGRLDSDGWAALMKDVLELPPSMLEIVQRVVRKGSWLRANNPVMSVTATAKRQSDQIRVKRGIAAATGE